MNFKLTKTFLAIALTLGLAGCADDGDTGPAGVNGADGANGENGIDGAQGLASLLRHTTLYSGNEHCFSGGTAIDSGLDLDSDGVLADTEVTSSSTICASTQLSHKSFNRIASFPVCSQIDINCNDDTETSAEIVSASEDGLTLVYTDSPNEQLGFINITDPANPVAAGTLALAGEPTSVSVIGNYALVGINSSANYIDVAGSLAVINIETQALVATIDLGGQPDSVAVSPDGMYAVIAIENERDEDLGDGVPPQAPAGYLSIVELSGEPNTWTATSVDFTGIADLYADDPEPEFVDINSDNIAVVTLQENNHIILVDLADASILNEFSAGTVDLTQVDKTEEEAVISQTESLDAVLREPDGVTWLGTEYFATADEGDLDGGSRGFTVFNKQGEVVYAAGSSMEHMVASVGHYPDARSKNKGNEPENAEYGVFGDERYLFVNSERSSLVFVYDVADYTKPMFKQVLPAGVAPEGALAIPSRNLLVVASEADERDAKMRSVVNIYNYSANPQQYPTIQSTYRVDGTPIPFSALSGLSADPQNANLLYSVEDSFYLSNRIFTIDTSVTPASLIKETYIKDTNDVFSAIAAAALVDNTVDADDATRVDVFDEADLAGMINSDKTVNIDPEGIAKASDGGFWVASEGSGTKGDSSRPINSLNFIFKTDVNGVIEEVITLPDAINDKQLRFGFEGVTEYAGNVYVAFQRVWAGDNNVRLGVYNTTAKTWSFLYYPLDATESQNGGWVGLSDITSLNNGQFLVLERDNQGGPDAAIKRIYHIDTAGLVDGDTVTKTLVRDVLPDMKVANGLAAEKVEGMAVMANGEVYIVNDNDGVDDNSGEIQLTNLGKILN
ncbi:esterase-like activity of phytase family protein [Paraglaciecola aquimarina]|uniref:Esterase-like activity of phytase family protein n=1 Tax=Paraglaciecola algarum TaxID=3050085 RepID=A0ABS9D4D5_9ALTE|nr:esterase-like activity of phytase family protein [Paraglaciecola sp. G1-23]MCF2946571.1 esterase-like activity of phytase family protein [Paraglaciecola sp. G1-23]